MATIGCSTATTQIGQLCATRHNIRVAGFPAVTQQAVNGRNQSHSVAEMMGSRAAMTREGRHRAYQYNSAWDRGNNTLISGRMPSFGSQSRGWWGNFLQISRPSSANASNSFGNNFGENVRVDNRATEPAKAEDPTLNLVEMKKADVTEKALDQGSTVANSALDKVGDVLRSTGLEFNLDVDLKELTIKELVLRDLSLVLEVRTQPQPQPQAKAAQAETPQAAEKDEGGNNAA